MSVNIEDVLLLKARQDALNREDNGLAIGAGAIAGGVTGLGAGMGAHSLGQANIKLKDAMAQAQGLSVAPRQKLKDTIRPGGRMTGMLVGTMLGGGLGAGVQHMLMRESPAAAMLAKVQSQGSLTSGEIEELEGILKNSYNQMLA